MLKKFLYHGLLLFLCLTASSAYAQPIGPDGLGETIQIYTRFRSFLGKPSLLLIIRDVDSDQSIPYLFDVTRGDDFWFALTYGRNYLIQTSTLTFRLYQPRYNTYKSYVTHDFCHLETQGRIIRGEALYITIEGDLTPNTDSYTCHVSRFTDANFVVVKPE